MKKKFITAAACLAMSAAPAAANDDFVKGLMGVMIGAAIANQGNANTRARNAAPSGGGGVPSAERQKNKESQEALNYFGFDAGVPDGVFGRKSRTAVSQMQACINRPITGTLDAFEVQFLKNSYFKAQAGGNETLRLVASKPNGYCGVLQQYHLELTQPAQPVQVVQPAPVPQPVPQAPAPRVATQQNTTVVLNQQTTQTNNVVVVIDAELQTKFDLMVAQLKLLEQIQAHIDAKVTNEASRRKLATVMERMGQLRSMIREIKQETKGKYGTPIKPTNANLGVTAVKASEVFPRVPYYIPGTDETGELWIKPYVTDDGRLMYDFNFVAAFSDFERIKDTIEMTSENVRDVADALVKVTEWSDLALSKGMRRRYEKSAVCFPQEMCGKTEAGNNSAEVIFMLYEDGSTAARLQENKGRFRSGYNLSVESGLLLSAYMDYMAEVGEKEFEANTMTDSDLDNMFKD
jgi:peptidoglycan hydrolase-like protein with peptidoglycan-binding domain